jgi:uncharacterized membrane protein YqjE
MGLLDSAQSLLAGVLTRLFLAVLCAITVLLLGALAAGFAGLALMILYGEENPALAAGIIALVFLALAAAAAFGMRRLIRGRPRAFDASLKELERDCEALVP